MLFHTTVLAIMLAASNCGNAHSYSSEWASFLSQADDSAFKTLETAIGARVESCGWGHPDDKVVAPTSAQTIELLEFVEGGNTSAFRAGLLISRCLGVAYREDFYRNSGVYFEGKPLEFLIIVRFASISERELKSLLVMLPLDTVDDHNQRLTIIERRITLLKQVDDSSLEEIVSLALSNLNAEKESLIRVHSEVTPH